MKIRKIRTKKFYNIDPEVEHLKVLHLGRLQSYEQISY
jgi:hypothetical protein